MKKFLLIICAIIGCISVRAQQSVTFNNNTCQTILVAFYTSGNAATYQYSVPSYNSISLDIFAGGTFGNPIRNWIGGNPAPSGSHFTVVKTYDGQYNGANYDWTAGVDPIGQQVIVQPPTCYCVGSPCGPIRIVSTGWGTALLTVDAN